MWVTMRNLWRRATTYQLRVRAMNTVQVPDAPSVGNRPRFQERVWAVGHRRARPCAHLRQKHVVMAPAVRVGCVRHIDLADDVAIGCDTDGFFDDAPCGPSAECCHGGGACLTPVAQSATFRASSVQEEAEGPGPSSLCPLRVDDRLAIFACAPCGRWG